MAPQVVITKTRGAATYHVYIEVGSMITIGFQYLGVLLFRLVLIRKQEVPLTAVTTNAASCMATLGFQCHAGAH